MKRIAILLLSIYLLQNSLCCNTVYAENDLLQISAPSALLMDYSTGQIIYEKKILMKKDLLQV